MNDMIEKIARAICELRIREVRRFYRTPEEIERQLTASVDYAWGQWVPEATAALAVALDAIGEECAGIADRCRDHWSGAGGFGGHSAAARIIGDNIRASIAEMEGAIKS